VAGQEGVDATKFSEVYKLFRHPAKVSRAMQLTESHGLDGVPVLIVDGRYRAPGDGEDALVLVDQLIDKARKERMAGSSALFITGASSASAPELARCYACRAPNWVCSRAAVMSCGGWPTRSAADIGYIRSMSAMPRHGFCTASYLEEVGVPDS